MVNAAVFFNARSATLSSGTQLRRRKGLSSVDDRAALKFHITGPLATQCGVEGFAPLEAQEGGQSF